MDAQRQRDLDDQRGARLNDAVRVVGEADFKRKRVGVGAFRRSDGEAGDQEGAQHEQDGDRDATASLVHRCLR